MGCRRRDSAAQTPLPLPPSCGSLGLGSSASPTAESTHAPLASVGCGYLNFRKSATMTGTILCAVNDSQSARGALQLAAALSERLRVRLVVAHVASGESIDQAERLVSRLILEAAPAG